MNDSINEPILNKLDEKHANNLRLVTFNINGINTLFNYYPWNKFNQDLNQVFLSLKGDIITLQELKLTNNSLSTNFKSLGHLSDFKSFISLPKYKKGYSGVGVFIRVPKDEESPQVKYLLSVMKAEDGITGWLNSPESQSCYREDTKNCIGGYPMIEKSEGLLLDQEGRCVVVELANNMVVISVYCPANSMQTAEGELFRINFLINLFKRAKNLYDMHKQVVLMGDININLDLIDNYEEIQARLQARLVRLTTAGESFEIVNYEECINFKSSTKARRLLNDIVVSQVNLPHEFKSSVLPSQFLYDSTRQIQGRKLNMFTVWNTMKNLRNSNIGSRIDLILVTKSLLSRVTKADIWPFLLGSDHCPVFTDIELTENYASDVTTPTKLLFEAKYFYKLIKDKDIMGMFFAPKKSKEILVTEVDNSIKNLDNEKLKNKAEIDKLTDDTDIIDVKIDSISQNKINKPKLVYKSRKIKRVDTADQQSIQNYFKNR